MAAGEPTERFDQRTVRVVNPDPENEEYRNLVGLAHLMGVATNFGELEVPEFTNYSIEGADPRAAFMDRELDLAE